MAKGLEALKKITKLTAGAAGVAALPISAIALTQQPETPQIEQPQPEIPQVEQPQPKDLEGLKKLENKVEGMEYDVEFNQSQIGRNQLMLIDIDNKLKKIKVDFEKEKAEILKLFEHIKQFKNYRDVTEIVNHINKIIKDLNEWETRLVKTEDAIAKAK